MITSKSDSLTVSQLNRQAKRLLEGHFPSVWVEGEISNLSKPSSGHWYFSLKDSSSQIRCAMFRSNNARLKFLVESGQQVMARAKLSLYEARGDYQLIVEHLEPAGDGALAKAFEALKAKLSAQGLFDPSQKSPLPTSIRHIAVVTSPTGAAIRDILAVLKRRFPIIKITIFPCKVQGQEASQQIAKSINKVNKLVKEQDWDFDVILIGRGGGSLEDLWAFNEEVVAHSIHNSALPVVSAVGHEIDFTISDFVADVRAPTPSAAAELLSPDQRELLSLFHNIKQRLIKQVLSHISDQKRQVDWVQSRLKHPGNQLQEHNLRLDELEMRLLTGWQTNLRSYQHRLDLLSARLQQQTPSHTLEQLQISLRNFHQRLQKNIQYYLEQKKTKLNSAMQLLNTVSPLATLDRGYSIVTNDNGEIITHSEHLKVGDTVHAQLAKGNLSCTINHISNNIK